MRIPLPVIVTLTLLTACADEKSTDTATSAGPTEGRNPGECTDGADNDADGDYDCNDDDCAGAPDCATTNAAPSGAAIAIEPSTPLDADDLRCVVTTPAVDPDGDTVAYRFAWRVDEVDAGLDTSTVSAALTLPSQTWTCEVTPYDGTLDGATATASVSIAQGNRAPSAPTVSISPAAPTDDDVLTCVIDGESVDPDGDTVTYAYAWSVDGVNAGLSSATVNAGLTSPDQTWTCSVTASDGSLSSAPGTATTEIAPTRCLSADFRSGGHIVVPNRADLDLSSTLTVAFWTHVNTVTATGSSFLSNGISSRYCGSYASGVTGARKIGFNTTDGTSNYRCDNSAHPLPNFYSTRTLGYAWTHVAIVYDGATLAMFLDGTLDAEVTASRVDPYVPEHDLWIGREDGYERTFDGQMRDIALWDRALSDAEVATLADRATVPSGLRTDLVAWWPLDEGAGTTARDASGNGHHGSFLDAAWTETCP